jgi:hypothetical protein
MSDPEPFDAPVAVLLPLDGGMPFIWALTALPPPIELLVPRPATFSASIADAAAPPAPLSHRRFVLDTSLRSRLPRWWNVYNDGRSRTPEDGFVYREVKAGIGG